MSDAEMSLSLAVKTAALGLGTPFALSKRVNMCRSSFERYVSRFKESFGDTPEEVVYRSNISIASSSDESWDSLREKRLRAVLSDDFNGVVPPRKKGRPTYLSAEVEGRIHMLLGFCGDRQCPMDFALASGMVSTALRQANVRSCKDGRLVTDPSRHHISGLLRRGDLALKTPEKLEITDNGGLSKQDVRDYASVLSGKLDAFSPPSFSGDNVWNLDETGFCMETIGRSKGIYLKIQRKCQLVMNATGDRVSAMFAVSASGRLGPVALVYPRKGLPASFIMSTAEICPDWQVWGNDKGWFGIPEFMRYVNAFADFLDTFRPADRRDIVIMDNLAVHANVDVLRRMDERRLDPVFLPARSTSYLQPLDVCLYGPLKIYFYRNRNRWAGEMILGQLKDFPNLPSDFVMKVPKLTIWEVPQFLKPAVGEVFQKEKIQEAFVTCGVCPFRLEKMLSRLSEWAPETSKRVSKKKGKKGDEVTIPVVGDGEDGSLAAYRRRLAAKTGT